MAAINSSFGNDASNSFKKNEGFNSKIAVARTEIIQQRICRHWPQWTKMEIAVKYFEINVFRTVIIDKFTLGVEKPNK